MESKWRQVEILNNYFENSTPNCSCNKNIRPSCCHIINCCNSCKVNSSNQTAPDPMGSISELLKYLSNMDCKLKDIVVQSSKLVSLMEGHVGIHDSSSTLPVQPSSNPKTDKLPDHEMSGESLNTTYDENMDIGTDLSVHLNENVLTNQSSRLVLQS